MSNERLRTRRPPKIGAATTKMVKKMIAPTTELLCGRSRSLISTTAMGCGAATATSRREPWAPTEYIASKSAKIGTEASLEMSGMSNA